MPVSLKFTRNKIYIRNILLIQLLLSKVLFAATMVLSVIMMCLKGFNGPWYFYLFRFVLLFSYLIPISLRVNLDIAKIYHSMCIQVRIHDSSTFTG